MSAKTEHNQTAGAPVKRLQGTITSFVEGREFCFARGEDGQSYFVHRRSLRRHGDWKQIEMETLIRFEPYPGRKGLEARDVDVADRNHAIWSLPTEMVVTRNPEPRRGRVFHVVGELEFGDRDLEDAKAMLVRKSRELGANAVLGMKYSKGTGSEGNYRYTVHYFSGRPAIIAEARPTFDSAGCADSLAGVEAAADELQRRYEAYLKKLRFWRRVKQAVMAVMLLTIVWLFLAVAGS